jgi:hypothetical protein
MQFYFMRKYSASENNHDKKKGELPLAGKLTLH